MSTYDAFVGKLNGVIGIGVTLVAVVGLVVAALLIRYTQDTPGSPQGCFVVTDDLGRTFHATDQPQYSPGVGLRFKTADGEAWVFRPASVAASDACIADAPTMVPTPARGGA